MSEAVTVGGSRRGSGERKEEEEGGTSPGIIETEDGVWQELCRVGNN